jgi:hypothetical protein
MSETGRHYKKKVRKMPEPVGRGAPELMIDDFRLMIAAGPAEIFVLFVGFVVEEPGSRYSVVGFSGPATDYWLPPRRGYIGTKDPLTPTCSRMYGDFHPANVDGNLEKSCR